MDVAFELTPLVACKLIVYTFGALVHLFLMVVILGQRRLGRLEWLLFALIAGLFMWNSGNLLALNIGLFYGVGPVILCGVSRLIPFVGLLASAPLMVHLHAEYAARFCPRAFPWKLLIAVFYVPLIAAPWLAGRLLGHFELDPLAALWPFARFLGVWLVGALAVVAAINLWIYLGSWIADPRLLRFHAALAAFQVLLAVGLAWVYLRGALPVEGLGGYFATFLMLVAVAPSALVGYGIFRYNFLELRIQRNLVYSVAAIFGLLIYLNFMRRLSGWLEAHDILPAAVTEGVMIFILVVLLEPVKKLINRALHKAFVSEFERVQKLAAEIQEHAKQSGDVESLQRFVEERVPRELGLEGVKLWAGPRRADTGDPSRPSKVRVLPIYRGNEVMGLLEVVPVTSDLSGDLYGALQLLTDQLAAALELCQLIADKVKLERELAEKAKMAFLGEMAARIAHNVKNPLSSMKTLVQLLEEDSGLPARARLDLRMVLGEIDRLNGNISQVLRYAKPARDTDRPGDLAAVVNRVLVLTRAEAERRGVKLECEVPTSPCPVQGGEEAASDIVSNLVVNALEATPSGGNVRLRVGGEPKLPACVALVVEDDGRGIPPEVKEKIFQPFFTTRPGGTGLGLAIVKRRAEEIAGSVECASPAAPNGGTRFVVQFRAAR